MKFASLIALAASGCAWAAANSWTVVSEAEAEPIHSAIVRKEAWTVEPVRRLRQEAERRLREGPWSVTFDRPAGVQLDGHDYYSQAPYWWPQADPKAPYVRRDGQVNPDRFMANKNAINAMSAAVFTLGTAGYLLDEPRYAKRAAHILHVWFIDPKTRMNASLEYAQAVRNFNDGRGSGVLDGRVFIRAIQGMEFLAETGEWDEKEEAAVRKWFREYLHWLSASDHGLEEKNSGNNHATWWTAQAMAVATFVGDQGALQTAENWYREQNLGRQILAGGAAPREEARTKSLSYSAFNLEAMATVCRIAQVNGVDLWTARARSGATISTVIDYLTPFLSNPKKWPKEQIAEYTNEGPYSLAFAGMGLKKPEYIALYRKLSGSENAWLVLVDLLASRWEAAGHQTRH
ncbi:MAG: alginate lyase family protein [Acidobacteria bacterium]|nr:alginate lyase family protein [Acidobacteriota bacterium]